MFKPIAIPSFLSFMFGASLAFLVNIDSDNVAIMTAALIAALLTYYSSLVTAHNKSKDYREKIVESVVDKGRKFIDKAEHFTQEAKTYMPQKEEFQGDMDRYAKNITQCDETIKKIESSSLSDEEKEEKVDKIYKIIDNYRSKSFPIYDESRKEFNRKLAFFAATELECQNSAEVFVDEVEMIDSFYFYESNNKELAFNMSEEVVGLINKIYDEVLKVNIYSLDSSLLKELHSKLIDLRLFLRCMRGECLMGVTAVDKKNDKEKEVVFVLSIVVFLIGIGFMVSNGFKG